LKERFGVGAELISGKDGVFDVRVDGKLIFSKHELGRFPEPGEVEAKIERLRGAKSKG
jgi:selT/selW/selH-like putative selenoprotein